jgi:hypothetical protein
MKIKQTLMRFFEFLQGNRQTGHTKLLNKIGKEHDIYIIVHDMKMKYEFDSDIHDKLIPINNISILQGAPNKPVLLDNKVLCDLIDDSIREINHMDEKVQTYKSKIDNILNILIPLQKK